MHALKIRIPPLGYKLNPGALGDHVEQILLEQVSNLKSKCAGSIVEARDVARVVADDENRLVGFHCVKESGCVATNFNLYYIYKRIRLSTHYFP